MPLLKNVEQKLINMPKIYEYLGLIFFFYSNEHLPIHVHVSIAEYESKFEMEFENGKLKNIEISVVKGRKQLTDKDTEAAINFIKKFHDEIVGKWVDFFVNHKKVKCEIITKKVKK